jgi:hypothetical protein
METPHYDYDRTTGKFRGWLCSNCNLAIWHFQERPWVIKRAYEYLRQHFIDTT